MSDQWSANAKMAEGASARLTFAYLRDPSKNWLYSNALRTIFLRRSSLVSA
jgi:hypothetical protein